MTTITLELPDEQAQQLTETARQMNMTLEEYAFLQLVAPGEIDHDFLQLVNEIIEEDRELLESLA
jgi:hypothetical protein